MTNERTPDPVLKLNWIAAQDVVYRLRRELAEAERTMQEAYSAMVDDNLAVAEFNRKNSK